MKLGWKEISDKKKDFVFFLCDADFVDFVSSYLQIESGVNIFTERHPFYKLRTTKQKLQQKRLIKLIWYIYITRTKQKFAESLLLASINEPVNP